MPIPEHWPDEVKVRARRFLSLWKYYVYSRTISEAAVPFVEKHGTPSQTPEDVLRGTAFLSYWMASLHVLCEGWDSLGLHDPAIDKLLTKNHLQTLKRYRHTVFHFQTDLREARIEALESNPNVVGWVFDLAEAFQDFFEPHAKGIEVSRIRDWLFSPSE